MYESAFEAMEAKDFEQAEKLWLESAKKGSASAMGNLGSFYMQEGTGKLDREKSNYWYLKAAEAGNDIGTLNIGIHLLYGTFIKQDIDAGISWLKKALILDDYFKSRAAYELAVTYDQGKLKKENKELALDYYKVAAEAGSYKAALNLAISYLTGDSVKKDESLGFRYMQKAASLGDVKGMYYLATLYKKGTGVERDPGLALLWYDRAAEKGYGEAYLDAGVILANGEGVKADGVKALDYFIKAGEAGVKKGFYYAGMIYDIEGNDDLQTKAIPYYRKSELEKGIARANELDKKLSCVTHNSTQLFGETLGCTNRTKMREAAKNAKAVIEREDSSYFADNYDSSNILSESNELSIYYIGEMFARAEYSFPAHMDTDLVVRVKDLVASKYGAPHNQNGRVNLGEVSYVWIMPDGVEISVFRGWPDTSTTLRYKHLKNDNSMLKRIDELKKQRLAEKNQKQMSGI